MSRSILNADAGWIPDYDRGAAFVGASVNPFVKEPAEIAQFGVPTHYEEYAGPAYSPLPDEQYRQEALAIVGANYSEPLLVQGQVYGAFPGPLAYCGAWDPFPGHPERG